MNFASLNTALLQRARNPPRKRCQAGANPSPFENRTARFPRRSGFLWLKQPPGRSALTPRWLQTTSCPFPLGVFLGLFRRSSRPSAGPAQTQPGRDAGRDTVPGGSTPRPGAPGSFQNIPLTRCHVTGQTHGRVRHLVSVIFG